MILLHLLVAEMTDVDPSIRSDGYSAGKLAGRDDLEQLTSDIESSGRAR